MTDGARRAIHQFVPRLEWGAVGTHVLELQKVAVELTGRPSVIFAGSSAESLAGRCRPVRDYGRAVVAEPGDVLVYQSAIGSPVAELVRRRRQTLVVNFHNLTPVRYLQAWDPDATEGVLTGEQQLRQLAARATLAIADSTFNADHLRRAGYDAVAVAPVLTDPDALAVPPDPDTEARLAQARSRDGADWLFVGRLSANKCQHRVVAALAAYRRAYDDNARLWLVGGGADSRYGRAVRAYADSLGLAGAVTLTGPVTPAVLAAHYRGADIFVCLSEHEGFCVPLVEAMHHGLPAVAAGSSAIPETAGDAAVVLPMAGASGPAAAAVAAAVRCALRDRAVTERLIAAGRGRAAELAPGPTRQRFRALLGPVLDSDPAPAFDPAATVAPGRGAAVRVGIVVPAYGIEVVGGAQTAARMIAEQLAARDVAVEVFTTCAVSSGDWADHYPEATVDINGVTVHRFRSRSGRAPDFDEQSLPIMAQPAAASTETADRWLELQGPCCPAALDALSRSDPDVCVFSPYLFWPTVHGIRRFAGRAVLIPAAHDERPARLPVFRETFGRAAGLALYTASEQRLVHRLFPATRARLQDVIGLGVSRGVGDAEAASKALGLGERPFLLCLGRVDAGKGTTLLATWFAAYKRRRPGPLALVLAGPAQKPPPPHPDVVVTGVVSEAVKWGLLETASVLVSPSTNESLSLVLLEGWLAGRPALVNAACPVTRDHCRLSGGGVAFDGYATFEAALDRLMADPAQRASLGRAGQSYVECHYTWDRVAGRYEAFLGHVARLGRR